MRRAPGSKNATDGCSREWLPLAATEGIDAASLNQKGNDMKKSILILACAVVAPLAFAQTSTTETTKRTDSPLASTTETTTTTTEGTVSTFEPGKTIVVRRTGVTDPITYTLGKTVQYLDRAGKVIEASMIKPGAKVHVYYDNEGNTQVVRRVVVDQ